MFECFAIHIEMGLTAWNYPEDEKFFINAFIKLERQGEEAKPSKSL